jgi:O-methyltransferase involved in polyketide biosynthesis
VVVADLREDSCERLTAAGFAPDAQSVWVIEGLLYYLPDLDAHRLLDDLAGLCPRGSVILVDVAHPMMRPPRAPSVA